MSHTDTFLSQVSVRAFYLKCYNCSMQEEGFPQIPSFSLKRASEERGYERHSKEPKWMCLGRQAPTASVRRGSVTAGHHGHGTALGTAGLPIISHVMPVSVYFWLAGI